MPSFDFAQHTDPGRRESNEDYLGHHEPATPEEARSHGWLFALADGVGGHDRGEIASRAAVEHLLDQFPKAPPGEPPAALLTRLVRSANVHVYENARGGLTTLVACALRYDRAAIAHAGDSRCYLIRDGAAQQLTRDHTMAQDQAALGLISAAQAAAAETRHVLSRSLGRDLFLNVDTSEHTLAPGDVLALCCDGLYHSVTPADLSSIAGAGGDLDRAAHRLVDLASQRDGDDNISVQLIRIRGVERVGMYRGRPYKLR